MINPTPERACGPIDWPVKTREMHSHHFDSTVWNDLRFRDDDVVIATYAKSGTTWMQQIVGQLLSGGAEELDVAEISPWVDLRVPPKAEKLAMLEAQTHRRFMKTHLPVDALVFSPEARYIYVGRDGRDVVWSLYNHHANANPLWYSLLNDTPGRVGPPIDPPPADIRDYWRAWLDRDGFPFWSMWENVRSWWAVRHLPNVLLVHFADLKRDLPAELDRIAHFLNVRLEPAQREPVLRHCSFEWMKANAGRAAPLGGMLWDGGAQTFIHRGTNGRWRDTLTPADCAEYETRAIAELGPECAAWLSNGAR